MKQNIKKGQFTLKHNYTCLKNKILNHLAKLN
jgi:hypothetical protein